MLFAVFVCQKENENVICISPLSLFLQQTACKESIRVHCPPVATTMASEVKSPFFEASWQYMKVLSTAFFHQSSYISHRTSRHLSSTLCQQKCLRPICLLLFLSHSRRHVVPNTHSSSYPISPNQHPHSAHRYDATVGIAILPNIKIQGQIPTAQT